jgi:hypothetical protein
MYRFPQLDLFEFYYFVLLVIDKHLVQPRKRKYVYHTALTFSLLMSYIYGAPRKARNLTTYIYGRDFLLGILLLEPCISLILVYA